MRLLLALASLPELHAVWPDAAQRPFPEHTSVACPPLGLPGLPEQAAREQGLEVSICLTGVGPVNAGIALGRALAGGHVDAVLNAGLAGSFDLAHAPLGSVWRVRREVWPEYGLLGDAATPAPEGADARALGFPLWETPQGTVWNSLDVPAAPQSAWERVTGLTLAYPAAVSLTVAGVTNNLQRAAALHSRHGALLENMEGFAVALACARAGVPLAQLRVVSNRVGSRAPEHRAFGPALAALGTHVHNLLAPRGSHHA